MNEYQLKLFTQYESLRPVFEESSLFWELLESLRVEAYKTVKESEESAVEAFHYLRAVDKLEDRLKSLQTQYEVEKAHLSEEE